MKQKFATPTKMWSLAHRLCRSKSHQRDGNNNNGVGFTPDISEGKIHKVFPSYIFFY
jgi:hypothetical protein